MFRGSNYINIKDLFGGIKVPVDPQQNTDLNDTKKLGNNTLETA